MLLIMLLVFPQMSIPDLMVKFLFNPNVHFSNGINSPSTFVHLVSIGTSTGSCSVQVWQSAVVSASSDNVSLDASSVAVVSTVVDLSNSTDFVVDSPGGSSSIQPSDSKVVVFVPAADASET